MNNGDILIYLISCALNGKAADSKYLSGADYEKMRKLARKHYVSALVSYALDLSGTENALFKNDAYAAVKKMLLLDEETEKVCAYFREKGIRYTRLKGSVIKDLYPQPWLRERSDVDILLDSAYLDAADEYFKGWERHGESAHHVDYRKKPLYNFEIHFSLFDTREEFSGYFNDVGDRLVLAENGEYKLTDEDFYVYYFAHAYKHFLCGGIGLRTVADCYVMNNAFAALDRKKTDEALKKTGIYDFASMLERVSYKLMSIDSGALTEEETVFVREAVISGAFGTMDTVIRRRLDMIDGKKRGRKYILSRLFPDKERIQKAYPFSARHPWAVPFCMMHRLTFGAARRRKNVKRELKAVRKNADKKE